MEKPSLLFDREREWRALGRFVGDTADGPTLGVVTGRRRQGKSVLLRAVVEATGGFYHLAFEGAAREQLAHVGSALATFLGTPAPLRLSGWDDALHAFGALATQRAVPVVLDELPYLLAADASLASRIQGSLAGGGALAGGRARLLVCGSAVATMGKLLAGTAPLRGRASLELVVRPFAHREAARFWGLQHEPGLALRTYAVVGGTPAYAREFVRGDVPHGSRDFDAWVCRTVLDPTSPLFREARYLLADDPTMADVRERGLYHAVLAAVVGGSATRGGIASYLGRPSTDIAHPLTVLCDSGLLLRRDDPLRKGRPVFEVAEPLVRFYHAVMRPRWAALERGGLAERVWADTAPTFRAQVLGPVFEELCRAWVLDQGLVDEIGLVEQVGSTQVSDAAERAVLQVDVVALGGAGRRVALLGEAKVGETMGIAHVTRLRRARKLLARAGHDTSSALLACFSGGGFTPELVAASATEEVALVDVARLYAAPRA